MNIWFRQKYISNKERIGQKNNQRPLNGMRNAFIEDSGKKYITHTTLPKALSAIKTISFFQLTALLSIVTVFLIGIFLSPLLTLQISISLLSFIYFIDLAVYGIVNVLPLHTKEEILVSKRKVESLNDYELPIYSILCPLYKEADIVPQFIEAISELDWPKDKLDVLLLLEEDDKLTINQVKSLNLPEYFRLIIVPDSLPKTKPKACNYGLSYAKGEYVVIYDAEDKPESDQLKKIYCAFKKLPKNIVCLQAKLNYYNSEQNLLTRLFSAEYSLWFDLTLPGLQSLQTTIPLGGTSNHFRRSDLLSLQGWDPFNVTEDADLGVRLFKLGYKTAIVDTTTFEEANSNIFNWIRQRSRWIKGYMQTYLVHTRDSLSFFKYSPKHALLFHLTFGGKIAFILINPILWLTTIAYFALRPLVGEAIESLYSPFVLYGAVISLVFGNFIFFYSYMIGCAKREQWNLVKYVFFMPFYWIITSIAATISIYQLIFKPHYWEKTVHGFHLKKGSTMQVAAIQTIPQQVAGAIQSETKRSNHTLSARLTVNGFVLAGFSVLFSILYYGLTNFSFKYDLIFTSLVFVSVFILLVPVERILKNLTFQKILFSFSLLALFLSTLQIVTTLMLHSTLPNEFLLGILVTELLFIIFVYFSHFRKTEVIDSNVNSLVGLFSEKQFHNSKKKNVLIFNWRDIKHVWAGGAERYIHEISKRWVKSGSNVTLFCSNDNKNPSEEVIDGVRIIRRGGHYTVYFWAFLYYLLKFRGKYDTVIDCENGIPFFTPIYVRKPIYLIIHHVHQDIFRKELIFPASVISKILEGKLMPLLYKKKKIITVSPSSKHDIEKLGFRSKNITINHNGVNKINNAKHKKTIHPSFVYVGRLKGYKNLDILIEAIYELTKKYPDAKLSIAGTGEKHKDLKKLIKNYNIEKSVKLLGKVSETEKYKLFSESWAALHPSNIEGWGITVLEANSCGTPVIASNVNGLKDSVRNGKTGLLVHPNKINSWINAMEKIIENKMLYRKLSNEALNWSKNFSWDQSANKLYQAIFNESIDLKGLDLNELKNGEVVLVPAYYEKR